MLKMERRCCSITSVNRIIPYNKERGRLLIHIPFNEAIASINLPARYGFCTYLASKVIKAAKYIGMNLLQSLYCTHVFIRHQIAFNQRVCFLLASSVNTVITIGEPIEESICFCTGIIVGDRFNALIVKSI